MCRQTFVLVSDITSSYTTKIKKATTFGGSFPLAHHIQKNIEKTKWCGSDGTRPSLPLHPCLPAAGSSTFLLPVREPRPWEGLLSSCAVPWLLGPVPKSYMLLLLLQLLLLLYIPPLAQGSWDPGAHKEKGGEYGRPRNGVFEPGHKIAGKWLGGHLG